MKSELDASSEHGNEYLEGVWVWAYVLCCILVGWSTGVRGLFAVFVYLALTFMGIPNFNLFATLLAIKLLYPYIRVRAEMHTLLQPIDDPAFIPWNELYPKLKRGDAVEFERTSFRNLAVKLYHWGVYTYDDTVIHLQNEHGKVEILAESLQTVAQGGKCRINNMERLAAKFGLNRGTLDEVLKRSRMSKKSGRYVEKYDMLTQNCQHFVTYLLYGEPFSPHEQSYVFYARNFLFDTILVYLPYMAIYYIYKDHWWSISDIRELISRNEIATKCIFDTLLTMSNFIEEHEYIYLGMLVVVGVPLLIIWHDRFCAGTE